MKPVTKVPEEELARMIEERVSPLGEKLEEISTKLTKDREKHNEERIEEIIAKIKSKSSGKIKKTENEIREENEAKEGLDKTKKELKELGTHDVNNEIDCPTCGKHVHKMIGNGLTVKCTGDKCGEEYVLISKNADHVCADCGLPIKKPAEGKKLESCPSCRGNKAIKIENGVPEIKFDFTKLKK